MCGISGVFAFTENGKQRLKNTEAANNSLYKRGPDGGRVYTDAHVALGHRRLSIIDVSCAGDQPMTTINGRYTIVFNGEIFNYIELRDKFLTSDERGSLRSTSDTEVLLVLYARMGVEVFSLLRGFFAAAVYDAKEESLVIVRDRFGKKPLLYYKDEDCFCFASEIKALLKLDIPREIDWSVLPLYLQLSYIPQPYSMIRGVEKLLPGQYLQINRQGVKRGSYYKIETKPGEYKKYTYQQAQEQLVALMDEAVRLRLISDVPLGAFLSGGIDSSVVVALAARHTHKLKTFSIGYKDNPFFDETAYANLVAQKYNTEHTVFSLTNNDFLEHVHDVLDYIDEPFADSSAIPEFILSYYTRKHVTVALSGDGGDEVFAGYNKHGAEWRMRQGGWVNSVVKWGGPVWRILPKSRNHRVSNIFRQLDRFASGASLSHAERYWQWASFTAPPLVKSLLSSSTLSKVKEDKAKRIQECFTSGISATDFNDVLLADMNLVLLSDMLVKVDLMTMANSLEVRSPFLDQEVVNFAFSLPSEYKIDRQFKKKIVQDAFRSFLPAELYNRPKHGFEIPLLGWFRKELWGLIDNDLLSKSFIQEQEIFDGNSIEVLKRQLRSSNPGDSHVTIWALLVFQHWWKRYMS